MFKDQAGRSRMLGTIKASFANIIAHTAFYSSFVLGFEYCLRKTHIFAHHSRRMENFYRPRGSLSIFAVSTFWYIWVWRGAAKTAKITAKSAAATGWICKSFHYWNKITRTKHKCVKLSLTNLTKSDAFLKSLQLCSFILVIRVRKFPIKIRVYIYGGPYNDKMHANTQMHANTHKIRT